MTENHIRVPGRRVLPGDAPLEQGQVVHPRILRFLAGLAAVLALLGIAFAVVFSQIHTYGATAEEVARVYPGDELLTRPVVAWTHATTINSPPERVWPWVAQLGERRGGYYSYTFIENLIVGQDLYRNAGRIIPELQHPKPGDEMIGPMLKVRAVEPGQWLMAESAFAEMGCTWLWALYPHGEGHTRLVVRMRIQPPAEVSIPAPAVCFVDAGGFVMENKMMRGIRERAEGYLEPGWVQGAEIAIWLIALGEGLAAAWLFLTRKAWAPPLLVGLAAVLALVVFTFVQPAVWLRALVDVTLAVGLWWATRARALRAEGSQVALAGLP